MQEQIKIGDIVDIEFWDHAEDTPDALRFKICGEVLEETEAAYIVGTWRYAREKDRALDHNAKENENRFAIVKCAVIAIQKLEVKNNVNEREAISRNLV